MLLRFLCLFNLVSLEGLNGLWKRPLEVLELYEIRPQIDFAVHWLAELCLALAAFDAELCQTVDVVL